MFTGLIEACVPLRATAPVPIPWPGHGTELGLRLQVPVPSADFETARGDSVAVSGCCLTVAGYAEPGGRELHGDARPAQRGADLLFDLSAETLRRTRFGRVTPGTPLNLERSLRLSDRLGGHLVSGHVDGGATLIDVRPSGDGGVLLEVEVDPGLEAYLVSKGSIALDGVSLTVVEPRGRRFRVALIPETLAKTSLGRSERGARMHVEADMIGKWIEHLLARRQLERPGTD